MTYDEWRELHGEFFGYDLSDEGWNPGRLQLLSKEQLQRCISGAIAAHNTAIQRMEAVEDYAFKAVWYRATAEAYRAERALNEERVRRWREYALQLRSRA
jgi:hypothetical protein